MSGKTVEVEKIIQLKFDLGNMTAYDMNPLESDEMSEEQLQELSRENCQLLMNEIFSLPVVSEDTGIFAKLPECTSKIPREKPLKKVKKETKWESFAKEKGIKNRKRSGMVFDDKTEEYKPRYGYKSKSNDGLEDWCIEVPGNADPFEDQYQKRKDSKKLKINQNKARQIKNLNRK